jgi:hypothetical protein
MLHTGIDEACLGRGGSGGPCIGVSQQKSLRRAAASLGGACSPGAWRGAGGRLGMRPLQLPREEVRSRKHENSLSMPLATRADTDCGVLSRHVVQSPWPCPLPRPAGRRVRRRWVHSGCGGTLGQVLLCRGYKQSWVHSCPAYNLASLHSATLCRLDARIPPPSPLDAGGPLKQCRGVAPREHTSEQCRACKQRRPRRACKRRRRRPVVLRQRPGRASQRWRTRRRRVGRGCSCCHGTRSAISWSSWSRCDDTWCLESCGRACGSFSIHDRSGRRRLSRAGRLGNCRWLSDGERKGIVSDA